MVLDKRVYERLEGRWRDLFNRIKWDTIKSAVKSVAGLQGRKFKVHFWLVLDAWGCYGRVWSAPCMEPSCFLFFGSFPEPRRSHQNACEGKELLLALSVLLSQGLALRLTTRILRNIKQVCRK